MHVAVDAGAIGAGDGIARYLERLLLEMDRQGKGRVRWTLYGRDAAVAFAASLHDARARSDHLPAGAGRTAGLLTSIPAWAMLDRPEVFWGPAHRLPPVLPRATARVVTIHDLCWNHCPASMRPLTRWLDGQLMPRALRTADAVATVSEATRADVLRLPLAAHSKVRCVPPPPPALPPPGPEAALLSLGVRPPYALFVGTHEPRKNLHGLLRAFARLGAELPSVQLVVAGGRGWGEAPLAAQVRAAGLEQHVVLAGRVDDDTLATLYRHARMLVMPSLYEGFGLPLLEAMSLGTPVVTSANSSMPEVAGRAGLLVEPADPASIADAMRRLFLDDALHARLSGQAALEAGRYRAADSAAAMLDLFQDALVARRRLTAPGAAGS